MIVLQCENESCDQANCAECVDDDGAVRSCEWCEKQYCFECRMEKKEDTEKGKPFCKGCEDILKDDGYDRNEAEANESGDDGSY